MTEYYDLPEKKKTYESLAQDFVEKNTIITEVSKKQRELLILNNRSKHSYKKVGILDIYRNDSLKRHHTTRKNIEKFGWQIIRTDANKELGKLKIAK